MIGSVHSVSLTPLAEDNAAFMAIAEQVVRGVMSGYRHESIRIIRIDNWFSQRWYRFSGKIMGGISCRKKRLTVPPFIPARVVEERHWDRLGDDHYTSREGFRPLHRLMGSEENTRRYIDLEFPNGVSVWVSGRSEINRRGTIMVYVTGGGTKSDSWYVEMSEERQWHSTKNIGITRDEFGALIDL